MFKKVVFALLCAELAAVMMTAWITSLGGVSVAMNETYNVLTEKEGDKRDRDFYRDWKLYLLPFFLPQLVAVLFYPIAVLTTAVDFYLSHRGDESVLWCLSTTAVTVGNIIYFMSAGTTIVITGIVASLLTTTKKCLENSGAQNNYCFAFKFVLKSFYTNTLWIGTITALVGVLATTILYVPFALCWPHLLKLRRDRHTRIVSLLNVSTSQSAEEDDNNEITEK